MISDPPIQVISIHWIIRFGDNAGVILQAAIEAKTVLDFKDALQLIWSVLPEKAIDNAVQDYSKRQACVSASRQRLVFWRYIVTILTDTNSYI